MADVDLDGKRDEAVDCGWCDAGELGEWDEGWNGDDGNGDGKG